MYRGNVDLESLQLPSRAQILKNKQEIPSLPVEEAMEYFTYTPRIKSIEEFSNLIGNRTRHLPACSIVPQPTTLPRAPKLMYSRYKYMAISVFRRLPKEHNLQIPTHFGLLV
jgi:hypothetical protein